MNSSKPLCTHHHHPPLSREKSYRPDPVRGRGRLSRKDSVSRCSRLGWVRVFQMPTLKTHLNLTIFFHQHHLSNQMNDYHLDCAYRMAPGTIRGTDTHRWHICQPPPRPPRSSVPLSAFDTSPQLLHAPQQVLLSHANVQVSKVKHTEVQAQCQSTVENGRQESGPKGSCQAKAGGCAESPCRRGSGGPRLTEQAGSVTPLAPSG